MEEDLAIVVDSLSKVQNRFDAEHSDPTGTSAGDDGHSSDGLNHPDE